MLGSFMLKMGLPHWPMINWIYTCFNLAHIFTLARLYSNTWGPFSKLVDSLMFVNTMHQWSIFRWFLPCSTLTRIFTCILVPLRLGWRIWAWVFLTHSCYPSKAVMKYPFMMSTLKTTYGTLICVQWLPMHGFT